MRSFFFFFWKGRRGWGNGIAWHAVRWRLLVLLSLSRLSSLILLVRLLNWDGPLVSCLIPCNCDSIVCMGIGYLSLNIMKIHVKLLLGHNMLLDKFTFYTPHNLPPRPPSPLFLHNQKYIYIYMRVHAKGWGDGEFK